MMKKTIWSLFERLRSVIVEKLMSPDVLESPRGCSFFYDGIDSDDNFCISDVAQIIVPLNDEDANNLSPDEYFTAQESDYHNVWYVYLNKRISLPYDGWQGYVIITLKTDNRQKYMLFISLVCYGAKNVVTHGQVITHGSFAEIVQVIKSGKFPSKVSAIFNKCLETVASKIEESERHNREVRLFADTDIADYDSVMEFVNFLNDKNVLKSKEYGIELFTYDRVIALINKSSKSVNVLVDRDGKAQFCRLEDIPAALLDMIRRERRDWNLDVHDLSVGHFNGNGQASVTWIISPYYYCPMDEDGFGEEEEFEVAVTCHINSKGQLINTPVWKPYTGPRR